MGKAIKVVLGDVEFRTMTLARDHFSAMLWRYAIDDVVSHEDSKLLWELLKRHPDVDVKIGVGFKNFEVIDDSQGSQCFAVRRIDGSFEDFSYKSCITEGRYK